MRPAPARKRAAESGVLVAALRPLWLAIKKPAEGALLHERRNGPFVLQVTRHPSYGLPWGQDRLVPIFLSTLVTRQQTPQITFESAAEMLDTFGMQQGGSQCRRLIAAFQRIFGATIFFGTDVQKQKAEVVHRARFNFMTEARIWYSKDLAQKNLPGDCRNTILLSDEFYRESLAIPSRRTWKRAKHCPPAPPLSTFICCCPTAALRQKHESAFLSSESLVW